MVRLSLFFVVSLLGCATTHAAAPDFTELNDALNRATLAMDNTATLALWEDDGISLLPATEPIVGKPALAQFLERVMAQLPGAKMKSFELSCHDARAAGDEGSEWCTEHQVVELGEGKPPFDGRGKMLLVLHRGKDGRWRIAREMWNAAGASQP